MNQEGEDIQLKIKTMDNKILDIKILSTCTIFELKQQIELYYLIPTQRQRLIYRGKALNNDETLQQQKLEDQSVIHLIATMAEPESSPLNRGLSTSSIDEQENRNQFDVQENRKNSRKRILQQRLHGFQILPNINSLQQNVMSLQYLLQSFNNVNEAIEQGQIFSQKEFELGQWIDFKDSTGEWIEGYISQKQQNSILIIHSKGEEWIQFPSTRIQLFRSQTIQKSFHMCPTMNINEQQQQQQWNFGELLGQTAMLLTRAGNMMSRLADSVEDKTIPPKQKADMSNLITGMIEEQRRNQDDKVEKPDDVTSLKSMKSMKSDKISIDYETSSIKSMKSDISKLTQYFGGHHHSQFAENIAEEEEGSSQDNMSVDNREGVNISKELKENFVYYETALLAAQIAPLSDRLGRLLIDISPYLALSGANINNIFQNPNNISNLSILTNEGSQYSSQPRQYYFQVPILLTPNEITQFNGGNQINRIVSEQVDIINHINTNMNQNNNRLRRISKKEEEEKQQYVQLCKRNQLNQQQEKVEQDEQQQQQQQQQQQNLIQCQPILSQQQKNLLKESSLKEKKKIKTKEVSFSEQIDQLKKEKQF